MAEKDGNVNEALEGLDPSKRATLLGLARAPFAVPVVSSFLMAGLAVANPADAASSTISPNQTK
jgi:hypothetical protein